VSFAAITLCIVSQRLFVVVFVYFVTAQSGNFWIHPRIFFELREVCRMFLVSEYVIDWQR
jgi:hypothetical protein